MFIQLLLSLARKLYKRLRPYRWLFAVAVVQVVLADTILVLQNGQIAAGGTG